LLLHPIVVEILAPPLPLPKGRETGYIKTAFKKRRTGARLGYFDKLSTGSKRGGNGDMKWDLARPNNNQ